MAQKQGFREVRLAFETDSGNFRGTDIHIMDRIANGLAQVKNTNISIAFYDLDGHRLRLIEFGEASPDMRKLVDEELGTDEVVGA